MSQTNLQPMPAAAEHKPVFVEAEKLFEQLRELSHDIAQRAYEFFETRGREFGHELEDWFRAEAELMRHVPVEITESEQKLTVRAEVPGFKAEEIQVSVEPQRLVMSGKSETVKEDKTEQALYNERRTNQFCRTLNLMVAVEPAQATATLKDGVLELTLPKAALEEAARVAVQTA